ncbi:MAG: UDP-N-acetylmuramate:L-alanyl-gamma-D-glutamyl-meso-diaminopimelate ligase [Verrucomicrobiota bacterium]
MTTGTTEKLHFYFMGICGTAMGAVAAALKDLGHHVTGSDANVYPPMSTFLESKGIEIVQGFVAENVPRDADLIVIGNAMSRGNPEVEATLNLRLRYASLPEVMKDYFLRGKRNLVVSGTHGKTTTSSILAWLLESSGKSPNFMIGGIPGNFGKGSRMDGDSEFNVIEGDEYDTAFFDKRSKFVHYLPEIALVNNIEFDHADIFDDLEAIKLTFRRMINVVPGNGTIVINGDDRNCLEVAEAAHSPVVKVGFDERNDLRITSVEYAAANSAFTLDGELLEIPMVGEFNVRNAAMAATAAKRAGLSWSEIRNGLQSFEGIARRQQLRGETERGIKIIDDFGHHPTAMRQALAAIRTRYPNNRLWAIFEPRSNTTRRRVFQEELPKALAAADGVCIASIPNPEKFPENDRLDPDLIVARLNGEGKKAFHEVDSDAIVERLKAEATDNDVVLVFSNGGFGGIHDKLLQAL